MKHSMYKLIKKPFFERFMVKWRNPLTPEQQKEWQPVQTKSKSGGLIYGLFAIALTESAKVTIVLEHPWEKGSKVIFLKIAISYFGSILVRFPSLGAMKHNEKPLRKR